MILLHSPERPRCLHRESLCTLCPQSGCFTRRAADLALRGERPYLEGCCTVCNYVFWKSRSAKDGVKALDTGDKRRRRSVGRAAREALEAIIDAGAISCGSAYAFWLKNLRELHDLSGAGPGTDYTLRMVFPPGRAWKPEVILDVAWKWNGVRASRQHCPRYAFMHVRPLLFAVTAAPLAILPAERWLQGAGGDHRRRSRCISQRLRRRARPASRLRRR